MLTIEQVCKAAKALPASPSILPKVVALLSREDADLSDLEDVIRMDQALAASVLKYANSALFGGGQQFDNLADAILRLGFNQTYRLTVTVSSGRWGTAEVTGYGWETGDFCRHSFAVAVGSQLVAEKSEVVNGELAYTAGIMHDAGKLALAHAASDLLEKVSAYQQKSECDWIQAENNILGFSHMDVTVRLMQEWNFPDNLIAVGHYYNDPMSAPKAHQGLCSAVHAGKHLAIQTGVGAGEDAFWTPLHQHAIESLGLSEGDLQEMSPELIRLLQKILKGSLMTGKIKFD